MARLAAPDERRLDWQGCRNVRDLGGLRTGNGRSTRRGAVVRGDSPDLLTEAGWEALRAYGIRTIVDLRNDDERDLGARPAEITTVHVPLDGVEDTEFWARWGSGPQFGTPLYYRPHLERFPERSARAIAAVADAGPGGVLIHCVGGRDRAGQISMLLLALAGVAPREIAADYCLSGNDEGDEFLAGRGTSASEVIVSTLAALDLEQALAGGGLSERSLAALRERLVD
jgi:protein-tyrosine phosphatase